MAQFDVHDVGGTFVVDCQTDTLSHFTTRVVAPLMRRDGVPAPTTRLHPVLTFLGEPFVLATHLLTAVPVVDLRKPVGSLADEKYTIKNALDMLLSGV